MLGAQEFRWVSNREVRYPVELLRPGLCPIPRAWRGPGDTPRLARNKLLLAVLNAGLVARGSFHGSPADRLRWLLGARAPFVRDGIPEVPIYAPLDCDLVGLPTPTEQTSPEALAYSRAVIRQAAAASPGELSMITFHDWIVSGGNRLGLLTDALTAASESGTVISTIARNPDWLAQAG